MALMPLAALGLGAAQPQSALAQDTGGTPVVQPLPGPESFQLSAALSRLGRNPRDIDALVDAGNAASALGDFEAAIGFFKRGQELSAENPRVLGGLAGALVHHGQPVDAIPLFARAERAGANPAEIAGNRGLAYDLVGDPATAQRHYLSALGAGSDEEITRRLAVSYAISGDEKAMERTIMPLLRKQDKAAWRTRAFALAILGKTKEAIKITRTLLPARLAESISPYLEYMPRLTAAQQASAANLGIFPRASEIGRDGTAIAAYTPDRAASPAAGPAGGAQAQAASQAPARALSKSDERRLRREARDQKRVAPPEPRPSRQAGSVEEPVFAAAAAIAAPPVAAIMSGQSAPAPVEAPKPVVTEVPKPAITEVPKPAPAEPPRPAVAEPSQPAIAEAPKPAAVETPELAASPGFDLARIPSSTIAAAAPVQEAPAQPAPPPPAPAPSFASAFGDIGRPEASAAPASGAVDIRRIEPARPTPPKPAPPPPPSHPSRIWVQLGIGQKLPALAFDWRRFEKSAPEVLKGRKPYSAKLNQTNRLLTGPFASRKEATDFLASLRDAGIEGPYIWTSPAGEVVDGLPR